MPYWTDPVTTSPDTSQLCHYHSGKLQPPAAVSQATGGDNKGLANICERGMGRCPVVLANLEGGVRVSCPTDSGSEGSTINEEFFIANFKGQSLLSTSGWLSLTGANGLEILYVGYFEVDVQVVGKVVPRRGILVVKDPVGVESKLRKRQVPGLVGMNVLGQISEVLEGVGVHGSTGEVGYVWSEELRSAKRCMNSSTLGLVAVAGRKDLQIPTSSETTLLPTGYQGKIDESTMAVVQPIAAQHLPGITLVNT